MNQCPYCQATTRQIKAGLNRAGSQRFQCRECNRHSTPEPKLNGYPNALRRQAVRLYLEGTNQRRIGRILSVNHQSVANWIKAYHQQLDASGPKHSHPATVETAEVDELLTFVGSKKNKPTSARS
ncbi:MAG TPA: helix-turn-helix domain-containing protein [Blastocatellia bacterium]|nr:helix-turn-helix domain-containing protein [Blastocatellia bacterium]